MSDWSGGLRTGEQSLRQAQQSDVRPRSVNTRVLRPEDELFTYDDSTITPVGGRSLTSDITGDVTGDITGRVFDSKLTKTSDYVITDSDPNNFDGDSSSGNVTFTLPTAADNSGRSILFRHTGSANNVILDGEGSEQVHGATTLTLVDAGSWVLIRCNGTSWDWIAGQIRGSNSDGSYVVFSSGIQVCMCATKTISDGTTGRRTATFTFPRAFASTPWAVLPEFLIKDDNGRIDTHGVERDSTTATQAVLRFYQVSYLSGVQGRITAIGPAS